MELLLVNAPQTNHTWAKKPHIVVKFAAVTVPKKDKAELERQLINEKTAYYKLSRING
jgi:hypothetical protein